MNFLQTDDFENAGVPFDVTFVESTSKEAYRGIVNKKIREWDLKYLQNKQQTHSKVKDIVYAKPETQQFLKSPLVTNENTSLLFSLRTKTAQPFRANFNNLYGGKI